MDGVWMDLKNECYDLETAANRVILPLLTLYFVIPATKTQYPNKLLELDFRIAVPQRF